MGCGVSAPKPASTVSEHHSFEEPSGVRIFVYEPADSSGRKDVFALLDADAAFFDSCVQAHLSSRAAVIGQEGRHWFPELVLVGVQPPKAWSRNSPRYTAFIQSELPDILGRFGTKPYGGGRAIGALHASLGLAILRSLLAYEHHEVHKLYRFYLLGLGGDAGVSASMSTSALPDKTAVFLSAAHAQEPAARKLEAALLRRTDTGATDTSMFVTRDGEQTYTQHARKGPPPVTLDLVDAADASSRAAFASRAMLWLGERVEAQKLVSLGSLLPWHEFK